MATLDTRRELRSKVTPLMVKGFGKRRIKPKAPAMVNSKPGKTKSHLGLYRSRNRR
jgi:hypothetical protein